MSRTGAVARSVDAKPGARRVHGLNILTGSHVGQPDHGLDTASRADGHGQPVAVDCGVGVGQGFQGVADPADGPAQYGLGPGLSGRERLQRQSQRGP